MSRLKRFAHSLLSGYVLLGANMLYTLASVPLAWKYLGKAEFGLWALTTQIGGYILLVDFGMGGSVARILIDYKDRRTSGEYGSLIQTGVLVGVTQGILVFLVGVIVAFFIGPLLRIPAELQHQFLWLMIGQCAIQAVSFAARIFNHLLTAHQRFDVTNYTQAILFAASYGALWFGFEHGLGVYSILWAQATGILAVVVSGLWCMRLKLFPQRGEWGRPTWEKFRELFTFGRDIFIYALGGQLINASQILLLTRFLGLETAATWNIYTRTYTILQQIIYRIFDYSSSALAEMMVRREKNLLLARFRQIVIVSTSLSVVAGTLFALYNSAFVEVWVGKLSWSLWNDLLLAVWLVICVSLHAHTGLVGQTKQIRFLRYVFFVEGLAFVGLTVLVHRFGGVTVMLLTSIMCSLAFSLPYGLRRTRAYFELTWSELAQWHRAPLILTAWLVPIAVVVFSLTHNYSPLPRVVLGGGLVGFWAAVVLVRYGLGEAIQAELLRRAPPWTRGILARVIGAKVMPA